jgi:hypothetical protein
MYRIPADLDIKAIVGCDLNLLGLSRYDVQLNFTGSGITFCIQGSIILLENGKVIATWNQQTNWSSLDFQKVLNATVESYAVPNDKILEIRFDKGLALQVHDDLDHYETMQIYFSDESRSMIVV